VKKGRHRRFEEARALKHIPQDLTLDGDFAVRTEPCPECGAAPGSEHASWCLHEEEDEEGDD
jgi:hypothetical protein